MLEQIVELEKSFFLSLNRAHTPFWDAFMYLMSAHFTWVAVVICLVIWLFYKKPWQEALLFILIVVLMMVAADLVVSSFLKPLVQRLRPTHHNMTKDFVTTVYGHLAGGYSFPSGHATNFFCITMFTSFVFRDRLYSWIMFTLAAVVAYSRIYLGVHFISDVVIGVLFGLLIGWSFYRLYKWVRSKLFSTKKPPYKQFKSTISLLSMTLLLYTFFMLACSMEMSRAIVRIGFYAS